MISQKAFNNVTPTKTHGRQLKAPKIIIECHYEEANNKLFYLAQNCWQTKNFSLPWCGFIFTTVLKQIVCDKLKRKILRSSWFQSSFWEIFSFQPPLPCGL